MKHNRLLSRQLIASSEALRVVLVLVLCMPLPIRAPAGDTRAASTATELGTGFYDISGRSVFLISIAPELDLREADASRPGIRLVAPMSAGSFNFVPDDAIDGKLPHRIDSFSIMPGFEFDFPLGGDWVLTPWLRAGASFAESTSDGVLYGTGLRLERDVSVDDIGITQRHELGFVGVNYRHQSNDGFLRERNAVDVRVPTLPLGSEHRLLMGLYGILDVVPDAPAAPAGVKPSVVQLEAGITFNADPRPQLGFLHWPRLGIGYRFAGDFSGWHIVLGAPF